MKDLFEGGYVDVWIVQRSDVGRLPAGSILATARER
jgi:hypothetical protein